MPSMSKKPATAWKKCKSRQEEEIDELYKNMDTLEQYSRKKFPRD